jgi:hypothetical protein
VRCYHGTAMLLPWWHDGATSRGGDAVGGATGGAASAATEGWRCYLPEFTRCRRCYLLELTALLHAEVDELPAAPYTGVNVLLAGDEVLQVRFVMPCAGEVSRRSSVRRRW